MFKQYLERKDARRRHQEEMREKSLKQLVIGIAALMALLLVMSAFEALTKSDSQPTPTTTPVPTVSAQEQVGLSEAEKFADLVTKPVESLTSEDLAFVQSKSQDPCYAQNVMLPKTEMPTAIVICRKEE